MLSRLRHVDEVQYKRWNHYKVHQAENVGNFQAPSWFFSLVPGFSQGEVFGGGGVGRWGVGERQGEVVGISLNGGRFESFVLFFCFVFVLFCFGFYFRMPILSWTLSFRPFSKIWIYSENF